MTWYPVSYKMQLKYPHKISTVNLESQDEPVNMDDLTLTENDQIFSIVQMSQMPTENFDWTQMEITFEMDLDVTQIERTYYSILECLSDIGGILSILLSGVAFILFIYNYQHMDNFLAVHLFKIKTKEQNVTDSGIVLVPPRIGNVKDFLMDILPKFLKCYCRGPKSRNDQALAEAR